MSREIPRAEWPDYLDEFSREHRAWLATVDRLPADEPSHREAVEQPLGAVTPQRTARGVTRIEIRFQLDSLEREPIGIDAPTTLRVDETAEGVARVLEILDQDGVCTRIRFSAAPPLEALDGVAPGEVLP